MNQRWLLLAWLICLSINGARAQSLGDLARQQQERKGNHSSPVSNRVLTNDDLHTGASVESDQTPPSTQKKPTKPKAINGADSLNTGPKASAEEFKQKIQKQKDDIAAIQERIGELQSTINYVQNNRNIYTNGPEYNEAQKRKQQQVDQLKGILQERQDELKDLQEKARQAGFGSAVYN